MPTVCDPNKEVHLNDIGTVFRATISEDGVAKDITGVSSITFTFRKPDKTYLIIAGVVEDAANGIVSYTAVSGDLDQVGRWFFEVEVVIPLGTFTSEAGTFWVHKNL